MGQRYIRQYQGKEHQSCWKKSIPKAISGQRCGFYFDGKFHNEGITVMSLDTANNVECKYIQWIPLNIHGTVDISIVEWAF